LESGISADDDKRREKKTRAKDESGFVCVSNFCASAAATASILCLCETNGKRSAGDFMVSAATPSKDHQINYLIIPQVEVGQLTQLVIELRVNLLQAASSTLQ
jgi:hypothetical protein